MEVLVTVPWKSSGRRAWVIFWEHNEAALVNTEFVCVLPQNLGATKDVLRILKVLFACKQCSLAEQVSLGLNHRWPKQFVQRTLDFPQTVRVGFGPYLVAAQVTGLKVVERNPGAFDLVFTIPRPEPRRAILRHGSQQLEFSVI